MAHAIDRARTLAVKRLEYLHAGELGEAPAEFIEACELEQTGGAIFRAGAIDFTRED